MNRTPVTSSNIASMGYDDGTMEVEFNNGGVYQYKDVPESIYNQCFNASSVGAFFAANIKNNYEWEKI